MRTDQRTKRLWAFSALTLAVAGLAIALGTFVSAPNVSATEADVPATTPPPADSLVEARPAADATTPAVDPVKVTVYEGSIAIPETVSADSATFRVSNNGQQEHSFAVSTALSAPPEARLDDALATGQSKTLSTTLQPGTYIAYCPVEDHQARERVDFTVEP